MPSSLVISYIVYILTYKKGEIQKFTLAFKKCSPRSLAVNAL